MSVPVPAEFAWQITETAGTFNAFHLGTVAIPGGVAVGAFQYDTFAQAVPDGSLVYYVRTQAVDATHRATKEWAWGTFAQATNTITPVQGVRSTSSAPGGVYVPITWGSGASNVWSNPLNVVTGENITAFLEAQAADSRLALGLGTAALLNVGTSSGTIPLLGVGGELGAIGGANLSSLPPVFAGGLIQAYTGGSNSKICRRVSYNAGTGVLTVTTANATGSTDTALQLRSLWCRGSDSKLYRPGSVVPFAGAVADQEGFLGAAGAVRWNSPVTVDGVNSGVSVGVGWATNWLYFDPRPAFIGDTSGGAAPAVRNDGGHFAV